MRPTLRCVLLATLGVPISLAAALVSPRLASVWIAFLAMTALLIALDALLAPPRRRLVVRATVPPQCYVGERDALAVELRFARQTRPLSVELLAEVGPALAPPAIERVELPAEGTTVELPLVPLRRGRSNVAALWLRWRGPLGLVERIARAPIGEVVEIVPNVRAVRAAALRWFSSRELLAGLKVERYVGDGSEFDSLVEYMPGLDHRAIDWKSSARHRKLLCQEFRAERNHQIILGIDTGHLMSEPLGEIPRLDHAINAGLLLTYFALRTGDRVGLYGFDAEPRVFAAPVGGVGAFPRLQRVSAELDYQTVETNFALGLAHLSSRLRRRSLVVLLTDFVDVVTAQLMLENVHRLTQRHMVVFVALRDPSLTALAERVPATGRDFHRAVVAADLAREREVVLEKLRRMGVRCVDATPEQVTVGLLNHYIDIKRRELV